MEKMTNLWVQSQLNQNEEGRFKSVSAHIDFFVEAETLFFYPFLFLEPFVSGEVASLHFVS